MSIIEGLCTVISKNLCTTFFVVPRLEFLHVNGSMPSLRRHQNPRHQYLLSLRCPSAYPTRRTHLMRRGWTSATKTLVPLQGLGSTGSKSSKLATIDWCLTWIVMFTSSSGGGASERRSSRRSSDRSSHHEIRAGGQTLDAFLKAL